METRNVTAWALPVVIGLALGAASCSSLRNAGNGNSSAALPSPAAKAVAGPQFEILNAWKPRKVVVEGYAFGDAPPDRFTITPKKGISFVALELLMKQDDPHKPVPAAMWGGTVLLDSAGNRHQLFFSYAATMVKYSANGDSVEYKGSGDNKPNDIINKKLSESGGKLVVVFEAPPNESEFKLEIANATQLNVSLRAK
jgi:hypothetical protein